jgi:cysteine desulfurase
MDLSLPVYLDCAATTPMEPEVIELVAQTMADDFGNPSSRTHVYGQRAKAIVERARDQVADALECDPTEVVFTSGATESNNLFIAGAASLGQAQQRKHIVTTAIEHKSVLEPMQALVRRGVEVTFIRPDASGAVSEDDVLRAVRDDTVIVSVMGVNNETGVIQPIEGIGAGLVDKPTFMHIDAAQLYGKTPTTPRLREADFISISGHKIGGPKGIGVAVIRRRKRRIGAIPPHLVGGGQERGVRGGTLPTPLIAGIGLAIEMARSAAQQRYAACIAYRRIVTEIFASIGAPANGDQEKCIANIMSVRLPGIDSEAAIVALKDLIAVSTGSACTSEKQHESHVLQAMGLDKPDIESTIRISWNHRSLHPDWNQVKKRLNEMA